MTPGYKPPKEGKEEQVTAVPATASRGSPRPPSSQRCFTLPTLLLGQCAFLVSFQAPFQFSHTHALSHVELGPWGSSPDGCSPRSSSGLSGARRHLTQTSLSNSVSCYLLALYLVSSSSCLPESSACMSHRRLNHSLLPVFIVRFYHSVNCSSPKPKPPPFSHFTSRFTFPPSACAAFSVQALILLGRKIFDFSV